MSAELPKKLDRIDRVLVEQGKFKSRAAAQAAIAAGKVKWSGRVIEKASEKVPGDAKLDAQPAHPYVSRGGVKLAHALDVFGVDPSGHHCLDLGSSTGGFSDVLLRRGAASVIAVDVGRDQFDSDLAEDPRLTLLEGCDIRSLTPQHLGDPPSLIVCDISFVSLAKVLPVPLKLAATNAELVALFKPQFEVGPDHVGKGGLVRDRAVARKAENEFSEWLRAEGWDVRSACDSPVPGGDGNRERLIHARRPAKPVRASVV